MQQSQSIFDCRDSTDAYLVLSRTLRTSPGRCDFDLLACYEEAEKRVCCIPPHPPGKYSDTEIEAILLQKMFTDSEGTVTSPPPAELAQHDYPSLFIDVTPVLATNVLIPFKQGA